MEDWRHFYAYAVKYYEGEKLLVIIMRERTAQSCSLWAVPVLVIMRGTTGITRDLRQTRNYTFRCPELDEHGELWC